MKVFITCISLIILFLSCRKNHNQDIQFPSETQTGLNTFGCYIDGTLFISSTTLFGNVRPVSVYYTPDSTPYYKAGFLSIEGIDARYSLDLAGNIGIQT